MQPVVRLYPDEDSARTAVSRLAEVELGDEEVLVVTPESASGRESEILLAASAAGRLPGNYVGYCERALRAGRSVVSANTVFGRAGLVSGIMDDCGSVDVDTLPGYTGQDPTPLSDFLGLPVLTDTRHFLGLSGLLSSFSLSDKIGMSALSSNPAPLSSTFRLPTVTKRKQDWRTSFGIPLLSSKAAPLSSALGIKTLSQRSGSKTESFGISLLAKSPTPLSDTFGLPVLLNSKSR